MGIFHTVVCYTCEVLIKTKEMMYWKKPTTRNRRIYVSYINNQRLLAEKEGDFIRYSEDLVALGGELVDTWLVYAATQRGTRKVASAMDENSLATIEWQLYNAVGHIDTRDTI